ncbi:transcription termination/antitermination factor NusG [Candidatus Dependentiae bacterium]|nr:transcription termination/antitermination factor NusG [Candidatus Dependentiae bacterium]
MKRWYVVQLYAGYENIVKADLLKRIEEKALQEFFGEVLIPSAKMKQFFNASDSLQDQQLFPGYMLIQMEATPEAIRLVTTTPRISRFLGGRDPVPLSTKEIDRVLAQIRGEMVVSGEKHQFEVGKEVEIKEGPFASFVGIIESIYEESEKLTVMVSIFGRMTPVELTFDQVKR